MAAVQVDCAWPAPAGRSVTLFNDEVFRQVRSLADVPDDFANNGWSMDDFESGGGKGGCMMAFIGSDYIVKELSTSDHQSLLDLAEEYVEHIFAGETLLCAILLHFEDAATGRFFFVMRNAMGSGPFLALYDLKGCNDDKTLEVMGEKIRKNRTIWASGCTCGVEAGAELDKYNAGKKAAARADLLVTASQRAEILGMMQRDTQWLAKNQLMDYSLLVGVRSGPKGFMDAKVKNQLGQATFVWDCKDGGQVAVSVAIIDCLQRWTLVKKAAQAIKVLETNRATIAPRPYAERFLKHLSQRFVSIDAPLPCLLTAARHPRRRSTEPALAAKSAVGAEDSDSPAAPKRAFTEGALQRHTSSIRSDPEQTSSWWAQRIRSFV